MQSYHGENAVCIQITNFKVKMVVISLHYVLMQGYAKSHILLSGLCW